MPYAYNKSKNETGPLILAIVVIFAVGYALGTGGSEKECSPSATKAGCEIKTIITAPSGLTNSNTATIKLPAVIKNGTGVTAFLTVHVQNGTGQIYVSLDNVLSKEDTQNSVRMAALVASEFSKKSLEDYDFFYNIFADASMLEGPSAGAAMAVTTIAALENKNINQSVMITGTINHDGTIGPAGKIEAKAKAAKNAGASLFLVPFGELNAINYQEQEFCRRWGFFEYCQSEIVAKESNVESEAGIRMKEVMNIEDVVDEAISSGV